MSPEQTIQAQVVAYNTRNLEAFIALHASDVQLFNFGKTEPFAHGRGQIEAIYGDVFVNSPKLNTEILSRVVMGATVIDHEIVTGRKGVERLELVAIYKVEDGLIKRADFIR